MRHIAKWPSVQASVESDAFGLGVHLKIETIIPMEEAALLDYDYIGEMREMTNIIVKQFNGRGKADGG